MVPLEGQTSGTTVRPEHFTSRLRLQCGSTGPPRGGHCRSRVKLSKRVRLLAKIWILKVCHDHRESSLQHSSCLTATGKPREQFKGNMPSWARGKNCEGGGTAAERWVCGVVRRNRIFVCPSWPANQFDAMVELATPADPLIADSPLALQPTSRSDRHRRARRARAQSKIWQGAAPPLLLTKSAMRNLALRTLCFSRAAARSWATAYPATESQGIRQGAHPPPRSSLGAGSQSVHIRQPASHRRNRSSTALPGPRPSEMQRCAAKAQRAPRLGGVWRHMCAVAWAQRQQLRCGASSPCAEWHGPPRRRGARGAGASHRRRVRQLLPVVV